MLSRRRGWLETRFSFAEAPLTMRQGYDGIKKELIVRCLAKRGLEGRTAVNQLM
jgi:hypothetical protein